MATFTGWEKDRGKRKKLSRYKDQAVIARWSNRRSPVIEEIENMQFDSDEKHELATDFFGYDAEYPYIAGRIEIEKAVDMEGDVTYWITAYFPENSRYEGDKYGEAEVGYETSFQKAFDKATNLIELIGPNFSYADFAELNPNIPEVNRERFLEYKSIPEDYIFRI